MMAGFLNAAGWVVLPVMFLALAVAIGLFFWALFWGAREHFRR